jgi:hypothetical protein
MSARAGRSSAIAVFLCIVLGALLSTLLSAQTELLTGVTEQVGNTITDPIGLPVPERVTGTIIISAVLVLGWGVAYQYVQHSSSDSPSTGQHDPSDEENEGRYQTPAAAQRADRELQTELEWRLDDSVSTLDEIHDRLVDAGERERAERVASIREDVTQAKRAVMRQSGKPPEQFDTTTREQLETTHESLLAETDDLLALVRETHQADPNREFIQSAQRLVREIDSSLTRRQAALETGENR